MVETIYCVQLKDEKMIQRTLSLCMALLLLVACNKPPQQEYFPYTDTGVLKPRVALASVTDSSGRKLSWDTADEIVHGIHYFLRNQGNVFVLPQAEVYSNMALLGHFDLFGRDLTPWKSFNNADFVVLVDIFESKELPFEPDKFYPLFPTTGNHSGSVLALKARFKMIDLRGPLSKLLVFEVIESNHQLPFGYEAGDCSLIPWGNPEYCNTATGMVHNRLIYQLSQRINTLICDAR
jgi:hypothetical protein